MFFKEVLSTMALVVVMTLGAALEANEIFTRFAVDILFVTVCVAQWNRAGCVNFTIAFETNKIFRIMCFLQ